MFGFKLCNCCVIADKFFGPSTSLQIDTFFQMSNVNNMCYYQVYLCVGMEVR